MSSDDLKKIKRFVAKRIDKNRKKGTNAKRYTEEQLFEAIRRVGKGQRLTGNQYQKRKNPDDPSIYAFHYRFGNFKNVIEMMYGKAPLGETEVPFVIDELYLVKLVVEYDITNSKEYLEKRKSIPQIVPSDYHVEKLFKNWGNLFEAAKKYNIKSQLMKCLAVKKDMGRSPKWEDYSRAGVNVDLLKRKYYQLRFLNRRVKMLEEADEIRTGIKVPLAKNDERGIKAEAQEVFKPFARKLRS